MWDWEWESFTSCRLKYDSGNTVLWVLHDRVAPQTGLIKQLHMPPNLQLFCLSMSSILRLYNRIAVVLHFWTDIDRQRYRSPDRKGLRALLVFSKFCYAQAFGFFGSALLFGTRWLYRGDMLCFEAIRKSDYRERTNSPGCLVAASAKWTCCRIESLVIYGLSAFCLQYLEQH
jgi:hypothetical protein